MNTRRAFSRAICALFTITGLAAAASIIGSIQDQTGSAIPNAQVAAAGRVGVVAQARSDTRGRFELYVPDKAETDLVVTADGFETKRVAAGSAEMTIILTIAPQSDSIRVAGTAFDAPASEQGTGISVISKGEIARRNEEQALNLLRYLPGLVVAQQGQRGTLTTVSIRGGDSKYNLVLLDGAPINSFYYGGLVDFAHIPTDFLDRIEVARGPQSAIYGSYANAGVINFVTRQPEGGPSLDITAEGGSHGERRFGISASGVWRGYGLSGSISRLDFDGPVPNSDYLNQNAFLSVTRKWGSQSLTAKGNYNANDTGEPGPYGSNPLHLYSGIDRISRSRNYFSDYSGHYRADITPTVRQEVFASFFLNNSPYTSPYGFSFNKDIRAAAEARTTWSVTRYYTTAFGFAYEREEDKNTYIRDGSSRNFPLRRDGQGVYWENRIQIGSRLFVDAGVRGEIFEQPFIPGQPGPYSGRPYALPGNTYGRANPKISAAYRLGEGTRFHSSFGTGIRPPGGSDLAFTTNPMLKPELTVSADFGVEQRFLHNQASVGAAYFYNRYTDQIVGLGGNLAALGSYSTGNLSRSRAQGGEFTAEWRPARWFSVAGNYTYLDTAVLSLEGSSALVQRYYTLGQPLPRRPKHSGALVSTFHFKRISANVLGYFRGETLDVEPNYGVSAGFFRNGGYQNIGINLNYQAAPGLSVYGNLRNALNQRYEEIYGFPSPLLNFVAGVKWSLPRGR